MLSMTAREKYAKAVKRMKKIGCESSEEIIAGLENEVDKLREQVRGLLEKTEDCHLDLKKAICLHIAEGDTLIVKLAHFLKPEEMERTYEALREQMKNGLIILQQGVDVEIARGNSEKEENHKTPKEVEKAADKFIRAMNLLETAEDEPKVHELKILPEFYEDVSYREKSFELRKKDRDFRVGDTICLREWTPENGYTGRKIMVRIRYIYEGTGEYGLKKGYCILGIKRN